MDQLRGNWPGITLPGNIDLLQRRPDHPENPWPTHTHSELIPGDGGHYLVPTVDSEGRSLDVPSSGQFYETGQHFGKFSNAQDAVGYALALREHQEELRKKHAAVAADFLSNLLRLTRGH